MQSIVGRQRWSIRGSARFAAASAPIPAGQTDRYNRLLGPPGCRASQRGQPDWADGAAPTNRVRDSAPATRRRDGRVGGRSRPQASRRGRRASAAWPREADRFRCTVAVSATAKNSSAQAIWAISASRFTWSLKRSEGTRNPLVAGSSAARPTKQMTYFCGASVGIRRLFIVNADRSVQELRPMRMYAATAHVAVPSWRRGSPVPYRMRPAGCPAAYPGRLSSSGSREPR